MWQSKIDIHQVAEIRAKSTVYLGIGAIHKIKDITETLVKQGIQRVVVITGKGSHIKTGAWDIVKEAFENSNVEYQLYSKVTPNPDVDQVDQAAELARSFHAQAVICIGGGSPIDAGKSVAILLANPGVSARDIYEFKFIPEKAVPIIAINLTHGTGTEADRFAVVSIPEKEYKPAIAYDCLYPLYAIDDPALMTKLPPEQTVYVSVDAINHIVEASTTVVTNPYAILLARETVALIARYLPIAKKDPEDLTARYYLLYASMIAGISFDNGLLHLTHALEHPLSAVKPDLAHGLGLSMLLPAILKEIYPACGSVLADVLSPLIPGLTGAAEEAEKVKASMTAWLQEMGIRSRLQDEGFTRGDIDKLTELAFSTPSLSGLLSVAPIKADKQTVHAIYQASF